jgi:hypothetical protein
LVVFMAATPVFALPSRSSLIDPWWHATLLRLGAALLVALLLSTEFLIQPFIWRYFAPDEILSGWLLVMRDRLFVAVAIALTLSLAEPVSAGRLAHRYALTAFAIVLGAAIGEAALIAVDPHGDRNSLGAFVGRVIAWAVIAGGITAMLALWQRSEFNKARNHASELKRLRTERLLQRLRTEALQRQIEPHFLFNTLATIRRLHSSEPTKGRLLLSRFLAFLRGTIDAGRSAGTELQDELAIASAYLDVCAIRMGGALRWSVDVPDAVRHLPFPRFGLTTLVENAVKHGIAPCRSGGTVAISGNVEGKFLTLSVADNGRGYANTHGSGTGLANIREQLQLCYGPAASLTLASNSPRGVTATIRVPAETSK